MHYGVYVPNFGAFGDGCQLRDLAVDAESAGWDRFFLWDHLVADPPVADPWVTLGAIASVTRTIRFGPLIVPLPRRRPWKVAVEAATLQRLSDGRLILGTGMGVPWDYERFGEPSDVATRAAKLDEGVHLLRQLLAGENVDHRGSHYQACGMVLAKTALPIWVGGFWPRRAPVYAAATADGLFPNLPDTLSATGFRSRCRKAWRFESSRPHKPVTRCFAPARRFSGRSKLGRAAFCNHFATQIAARHGLGASADHRSAALATERSVAGRRQDVPPWVAGRHGPKGNPAPGFQPGGPRRPQRCAPTAGPAAISGRLPCGGRSPLSRRDCARWIGSPLSASPMTRRANDGPSRARPHRKCGSASASGGLSRWPVHGSCASWLGWRPERPGWARPGSARCAPRSWP
jgi:alkanesulfonate monooxygenase SsuD/methylene tetrahydromethanopterin reductase-like flavin-dependent oxidoreductase (luciferase family)